jgi:CIC family chloride channel protein
MGTFFAGFLRTPITSVFMVIEVSGSYTAVLPVMISSLVAYVISRRYQRTPLFDLLARQDGLLLPSIEAEREKAALTTEEAMQADAAVVLSPHLSIAEAARLAETKPGLPLLLQLRGSDWRLLDREEIAKLAVDRSADSVALEEKAKGPLPLLFRDQSLNDALHALGDWPVLPVVNRADLSRLEGVITLGDILRAFRNANQE